MTHVIEWNGNIDSIGDQVLYLSQSSEVVLGLDVFRVCDIHSREETAERCDTVSLSDTKD